MKDDNTYGGLGDVRYHSMADAKDKWLSSYYTTSRSTEENLEPIRGQPLKERDRPLRKDPYDIFVLPATYEERPNRKSPIRYPSKDFFTLAECLEVFKELQTKEIGDIYISGSVGLCLQGKLNRKEFKDLDIIIVGNIELDDEIMDFQRGDYPDDDNRRSLLFNGIPIDVFTVDKVNKNIVLTENTEYQCQHYVDIVQAKLNMAFEHLKDKDYLLANVLDIKIL